MELKTSNPASLFSILFSYAFRAFFLLGAIGSIVLVLLWITILSGNWPALKVSSPVLWHAHEMLVGFALAIVSGFVLTAVLAKACRGVRSSSSELIGALLMASFAILNA